VWNRFVSQDPPELAITWNRRPLEANQVTRKERCRIAFPPSVKQTIAILRLFVCTNLWNYSFIRMVLLCKLFLLPWKLVNLWLRILSSFIWMNLQPCRPWSDYSRNRGNLCECTAYVELLEDPWVLSFKEYISHMIPIGRRLPLSVPALWNGSSEHSDWLTMHLFLCFLGPRVRTIQG